ncbi:hypothetical protein EBB07_29320 [Paenibacillaceae bacterium]|nr:hypothetical protein EBB07_29320 [Paenibacillaceae bacterium]
MTKLEKNIKAISRKLEIYGYKYEVFGDKYTFAYAPTAAILTENCTIDLYKDKISVNGTKVESVEEAIDIVIEIEGVDALISDFSKMGKTQI